MVRLQRWEKNERREKERGRERETSERHDGRAAERRKKRETRVNRIALGSRIGDRRTEETTERWRGKPLCEGARRREGGEGGGPRKRARRAERAGGREEGRAPGGERTFPLRRV